MRKRRSASAFITVMLTVSILFLFALLFIKQGCFGYQSIPKEPAGINENKTDNAAESSVQAAKEPGTGLFTAGTADSGTLSSGETVNNSLSYYYNKLEGSYKNAYYALCTGVNDHAERIEVSGKYSDKEVESLFELVLFDHPEFFWVSGGFTYEVYLDKIVYLPQYKYDRAETQKLQEKIDSTLSEFDMLIADNNSQSEIAKKAYEYVTENVIYEANCPDSQNIISSLVNKKSVCAGYCRAFQYIVQQYGIEAAMVTGTLQDQSLHSWIVIKIDGVYYNVDPTFGDRNIAQREDAYALLPECDYSYFCIPDAILYRDRIADEEIVKAPDCTSNEMNCFVADGAYFDSINDEVWTYIDDSIAAGEEVVSLQFENEDEYKCFINDIDDGVYPRKVADILGINTKVYGYSINNDSLYTVCCWYYAD